MAAVDVVCSVAAIASLALGCHAAPAPCPPASAEPLAAQQIANDDSSILELGVSHRVESEILGEVREVNVWVPPSYAEGITRYPVLYLLDGGAEQDFHHISGLCQLASINPTFEELIVVGIATTDRMVELTAPATDHRYVERAPPNGGSAKFREHIASEVIPFVEERYRTSDRRALMGESLAGLFVAETLLVSPALATDYIAVSPSLWWDDQALAKSATARLSERGPGPATRVYLTMGDEGGTMQAGLDRLIAAIGSAGPRAPTLHYVDRRATDTHATIYHGAALDALRTLFGRPPPAQRPLPWYMREGGQPDEPPPT